jgi:hypothetical protein
MQGCGSGSIFGLLTTFLCDSIPSKTARKVNPEDKFALVFNSLLETLFIERMEQNEEVFARYMNDPAFQKVITGWLSEEVYRRLGGAKARSITYPKASRGRKAPSSE